MKERILVISSANIDLSVKAKRFPAAGETLISDGDYAYLPGGKGANASRALAALGADTVFLCRLGDDSNGRRGVKVWIYKGEVLPERAHKEGDR